MQNFTFLTKESERIGRGKRSRSSADKRNIISGSGSMLTVTIRIDEARYVLPLAREGLPVLKCQPDVDEQRCW